MYYHRLGTDVAEDQLVYDAGAANAKWLLSCEATDDHDTLLVGFTSQYPLKYHRSVYAPSVDAVLYAVR